MRKIIFLFTLFVLLVGCTPTVAKTQPPSNPNKIAGLEDQLQNLTDQIIGKMDQSGRQKIAIIEFSNLDGNVTELTICENILSILVSFIYSFLCLLP